jgi:DNA-directed RNA polymerase II subunit RPB11
MNAPDRLDSVRDRDAGQPHARRRVAMERDSKVQNAALFTLQREDHTVGHLLRMELLRDAGVRFAGYRHPHPLDQHIELRVHVASSALHPAGAVEAACRRLAVEFGRLKADSSEQVGEIQRKLKAEEDREL